MLINGHVDRCDSEAIEGWITVAEQPEIKLCLEVLLSGKIIGTCVADRFRADLKEAGIAEGNCSFRFELPSFVPKSDLGSLEIRLEGSVAYLAIADTAGAGESPASVAPTASRFGGLWIDRADWLDRLALKHRRGEVSDELSVDIFKFARDGYLVLEGAVSSATLDRLDDDIERCWRDPPEGMLIETFEPDGAMRYIPPDRRYREGRTKLLDLYAFSAVAREAIAAPRVIAFLAAIFADGPKAFQGLMFWNGSQQAIHKDTAYVKIDSNPLHLAATWLALEDVQSGTGELEYFVGSHRAPDYLFGGTSKWMEGHTAEHDRFLQSLQDDAATYRQVRRSFLAKRGDVLIWHADLAHGGAPITQLGRSRRSLVTHFTPASDEPFYRRETQHAEAAAQGCTFVSQYAPITPGRGNSRGSLV